MTFAHGLQKQQRNFNTILSELGKLGYGEELLKREYPMRDWFQTGQIVQKVDAAAFGQIPASYDSACFAVLLSNGESGSKLISRYRALGAPRAFEVRPDCVVHWKVSPSPSDRDRQEVIKPSEIIAAFRQNTSAWKPESVLRAKNITAPGPRQLDFVDIGLISALEENIREKLDPLLSEIIHDASKEHRQSTQSDPDHDKLFRLVFRCLAGKIMHDRSVPGFRTIKRTPTPDVLLNKVERHYRDHKPTLQDPATRELVVQRLWESIGFENMSVEVLAYIWENTLVSEETRRKLSLHATPPSIARYIVRRLPIEKIPFEKRRIVEPCCGSGTFLIAALQRLREILPPDMDNKRRHSFFARALSGFDVETIGLEIARSSLMLADFPNPNGWILKQEDVFENPEKSRKFRKYLSKANVVLCNPPFADFEAGERKQYQLKSVHKPEELLLRVLENTEENTLLGFVLPRVFIDGAGYRKVRHRLAELYDDFELVSLPDKVFASAQHETVLLMAQSPRRYGKRIAVTHRKVKDSDADSFLTQYTVSRESRTDYSIEDATTRIGIPDLHEIWTKLSGLPILGEAAAGSIHRGIQWNIPLTKWDPKSRKWLPIKENSDKLISRTPREGFMRGVKSVPKYFYHFQIPAASYLNMKPEDQKGKTYLLPWRQPKIVMNSKRKSRGPWRVVSFVDTEGMAFYQTFTCIWTNPTWDPEVLSAILNGPVGNAYVASHEGNRDVTIDTIKKIPVPALSKAEQERIAVLVRSYVKAVRVDTLLDNQIETARSTLRQIDALVLKAYNLPPRLERQLLEYFRGHERPVPLGFGDYYPSDFKPTIPLWMFDSQEFSQCTARNFLENAPVVTDPELTEILADL